MRKVPRAEWAQAFAWIDGLRAPGFNWDSRKIAELADSVECWGAEGACVFVQNLGDTAEILLLATSPEKRRKGAMRGLLQELFGQLSQFREWWLEVHEDNAAARELYVQLGFQPTGRRPKYYSDGRACILMSRSSNS